MGLEVQYSQMLAVQTPEMLNGIMILEKTVAL
jgi:hypothetical protein